MDQLLADSEQTQKLFRHSPVVIKKETKKKESQKHTKSLQSEPLNSQLKELVEKEQDKRYAGEDQEIKLERRRSREQEQLMLKSKVSGHAKRGRPPKFKDPKARKQNKLERDRINQQNYRKRKKYQAQKVDKSVKQEIRGLKMIIEEQKREIETLKSLRKFPTLSAELNTILSNKKEICEELLSKREWVDDQKEEIKEILNCQYHKYVAQLLEVLEQHTEEAVQAVQSFLIRFTKQAVSNIEQAYEELSEEMKEQVPKRHVSASPFKPNEQISFSDFLKGMMYNTHQQLEQYGQLFKEGRFSLKLTQAIQQFNKACQDYQMAGLILKEKAQELRSMFSSPVDQFKYLSSDDFAFILLNKDYLEKNVSDFKTEVEAQELKTDGDIFEMMKHCEAKSEHNTDQMRTSSPIEEGSFTPSLLDHNIDEIQESLHSSLKKQKL